jgi:hypothetical protein
LNAAIGRPVDSLTIDERLKLAGQWIALERYTPATLPLRMIEAIGSTPAECVRQLAASGKDPTRYEFVPVKPAW